ncbi:MAG: phosphate transport system regulatory protein PhoU [Desulfobacca sp.]|nr:phosphate transport system regulatory protein PhoU [Desulfobacca sp.]
MERSHINTKYDEELSLLKHKILQMGEMVEHNVVSAISSVMNRDPDLARTIITSDHQINELEVDTEEMCLRVIALRQPAGRDLRFISTAMKIITTLERMGDLATNIGRRSLDMVEEPRTGVCFHLPIMAEAAEDLVHRSLTAFVNEDVELALEVCRDDSYVDDTYKKVIEELLKMMGEKTLAIRRAMQIMFVAKSLERIADHAVHMAEMVVFMVVGKIIRHQEKTLDYLDEEFHVSRGANISGTTP